VIHSSIRDNWMRVEIMHSVAQAYYQVTNDSDFRDRMINRGALFPFDAVKYNTMEKESCVVGMVMAWSVVTLESYVNHAIAEKLNNQASAVMAIEFPRQITEKLKIGKSAKSELAKKLAILADEDKQNSKYITVADELSEIRNLIVHDKPFELLEYEDGEVEITHFRSRGEISETRHRFEHLSAFYLKCDKILDYVSSISSVVVMGTPEMSFPNLING